MTDYQTLLDKCSKPFKWWEHEHIQGNIYVGIHPTILRLNSLGVPWSLDQGVVTLTPNTDDNKMKWFADTEVQITIEGMGTRGAPGGAAGVDRSDTAKSAHSFALRKAASLFGIAHGVMVNPKAESNFVKFMETAKLVDDADWQKAVKLCAQIADMTPADWMTYNMAEKGEYTTALRNAGRI